VKVPQFAWRLWPLTKLAALLDERDRLRAMNSVRVKGLTADEREGWVLRLQHDIIPVLADALHSVFVSAGARNYLESAVAFDNAKASFEFADYTLTLQKRFRPTPHEFRMRADADLRRVLDRIEQLAYVPYDLREMTASIRKRLDDNPIGPEVPGEWKPGTPVRFQKALDLLTQKMFLGF
jgi:hypothetical protein